MVLPEAFLTSFYARAVQNHIMEHFASTLVVRKCFHLFKGTGASERTVAVLADGFSKVKVCGQFQVASAASMSEVEEAVITGKPEAGVKNGNRPHQLSSQANLPGSFEKKLENHLSTKVDDLMDVEIGLVTGANRYFVLDEKTVNDWRLPKTTLLQILARTADCNGLEYSAEDKQTIRADGRRCWLFSPNRLGLRGGAIRRYLGSISKDTRRNTVWFKKRKLWYSPEGYAPPDAFLTYMNHRGPRLILNTSGIDCTNTLHRINFRDGVSSTRRKLIAVSLQTTYSQISAERVGRVYGGGVLKLEPSEFRRLRILLPQSMHPKSIDKAFRLVNSYLRAADPENARKTADKAVLGAVFDGGNLSRVLNELNATLGTLRSQRRP